MTLSIRSRLTAWYSFVVVVVLVATAFSVAIVQERLTSTRLDGELQRLMLTLEGVMRNEFDEGLTLEAAAEEASIEVIAPDRTCCCCGQMAHCSTPGDNPWPNRGSRLSIGRLSRPSRWGRRRCVE
jgi:hypothetical protein